MSGRLEYLLYLCGLPSSSKPPVEIASTGPRMNKQDALAEISFALQGDQGTQVASALLRWRPELLSDEQRMRLYASLRDKVLLYGLTTRPRLTDEDMPIGVIQSARCAMHEHASWKPCDTCKGKGKVPQLIEKQGVDYVRCPDCLGAGHKPWTEKAREKVMGCAEDSPMLAMAAFGAAMLHAWSAEGVSAVDRMGHETNG